MKWGRREGRTGRQMDAQKPEVWGGWMENDRVGAAIKGRVTHVPL